MLIDRLIFGTGRLTGGIDGRSARRLLERALSGGFRHVDTAPPYGIGTAEQVVGAALAEWPDVAVTAKAGLAHPRHALAKTVARRIKRTLSAPPARTGGSFEPQAEVSARSASAGTFDPAFLTRSFERSRRNLRRDRVDLLLLHEAYAADAREDVLSWLEEQRKAGHAQNAGFSNGKMLGAATAAAFPNDLTAQCAVAPECFTGEMAADRPRIFHSVALTAEWLARTSPAMRAGFEAAARELAGSGSDAQTCLVAAAFAVLHARFPDAKFIYATTREDRLAAFLAAVNDADEVGCPAIARSFDEALAGAA